MDPKLFQSYTKKIIDNCSRIRQQYREFLKFQRSRGGKLTTKDTSLDMLNRPSPDTHAEGASQLRQVYLRARCDTGHEIAKEQMEQGKAALKQSLP